MPRAYKDPELIKLVKELTLRGLTAKEIAERLPITSRTVHRYRVQVGVAQAGPKPLTDAQIDFAKRLYEDECPFGEIARTLGCSAGAIETLFRGKPKPKNTVRGQMLQKAVAMGIW